MKIGSLVYLDPKQFYEWDEEIGVIVEVCTKSKTYRVVWASGDQQWFLATELELINESR